MSSQTINRKNDPLSLENRQRSRSVERPRAEVSRARSDLDEASGIKPLHLFIGILVIGGFALAYFVRSASSSTLSTSAANRAAELLDAQYLAADEARLGAEARASGASGEDFGIE